MLPQEGAAVLIVIHGPGSIELPVRCGTLLGGREALSLLHGALSWSIVGKGGLTIGAWSGRRGGSGGDPAAERKHGVDPSIHHLGLIVDSHLMRWIFQGW